MDVTVVFQDGSPTGIDEWGYMGIPIKTMTPVEGEFAKAFGKRLDVPGIDAYSLNGNIYITEEHADGHPKI